MTGVWRQLQEERNLEPFTGTARCVKRIFRDKASPHALVRAALLSDEPRWSSDNPTGAFSKRDAGMAGELFSRLASFGIKAVPFEIEIATLHGHDLALITTPELYGVTIAEACEDEPPAIPFELLERHYESLFAYYHEFGKTGEPVLADLAREGSQFMYGSYPGADHDLYLVDVEPVWARYTPGGDDEENRYYHTAIGYLMLEMDAVENRYGKTLAARDRIDELL